MAKTTPALRTLRTWLKADPSRSQAWLARTLGISGPSVSAWLDASARPTPPLREALRRLAGIPAESWETAAERRKREALEKRLSAAPLS